VPSVYHKAGAVSIRVDLVSAEEESGESGRAADVEEEGFVGMQGGHKEDDFPPYRRQR